MCHEGVPNMSKVYVEKWGCIASKVLERAVWYHSTTEVETERTVCSRWYIPESKGVDLIEVLGKKGLRFSMNYKTMPGLVEKVLSDCIISCGIIFLAQQWCVDSRCMIAWTSLWHDYAMSLYCVAIQWILFQVISYCGLESVLLPHYEHRW